MRFGRQEEARMIAERRRELGQVVGMCRQESSVPGGASEVRFELYMPKTNRSLIAV
jgi:hypothetical protein